MMVLIVVSQVVMQMLLLQSQNYQLPSPLVLQAPLLNRTILWFDMILIIQVVQIFFRCCRAIVAPFISIRNKLKKVQPNKKISWPEKQN